MSSDLTQAEVLDVVFKSAAVVGAVLAALGTTIGFFLKRYWDRRDKELATEQANAAALEQSRTKERDILYASLRWFEGGTQNRSIGIAVVNLSWPKYPEFHPMWVEVLANQVIYLLAASKQSKDEHERDNLRRMLELLLRERALLTQETHQMLAHTLSRKLKGDIQEGVTLSPYLVKKAEEALLQLKGSKAEGSAWHHDA